MVGMAAQIVILAIASLIASGVLVKHRRMLTYLATAGLMFEAQWLFLTLINGTILRNIESGIVLLVGAAGLLAAWGSQWKRWRMPYREAGSGKRDAVVLAVMIPVLASAYLIWQFNGFFEHAWLTHGFFNGDTATFVALTQRALHTDGLVSENPFAGNGALEYPTLLHAGWATLWSGLGVGTNWLHFLPAMTYAQIFLTVPMFFLLWDVMQTGKERSLLLPGLLVLYVLGLSWDNYVYPQSHFFLTGMFLLLGALLAQSWQTGWRANPAQAATGAGLAMVLLFSNAVTGTAAVAVKLIFDALHAVKPKLAPVERLGWVIGVIFWATVFWFFTPGEGALGLVPGFSYTAAFEMGRMSAVLLLLGIGVYLGFERQAYLSTAVVALMGLAFVTFVFSTRNIVIENASRFFYHAILIGFPLMAQPLLRVYYWFKREVMYSTRTLTQLTTTWGLAVLLMGVFLLPVGASVASTHDNLLFKDEQEVKTSTRQAMWWIEENTAPDAVVAASPDAPFAVPMFTGRALLRTNYWLSPGDDVLFDVNSAFAGDRQAQARVLAQSDYLLLQEEERELWEPMELDKVFDISAIVVYRTR